MYLKFAFIPTQTDFLCTIFLNGGVFVSTHLLYALLEFGSTNKLVFIPLLLTLLVSRVPYSFQTFYPGLGGGYAKFSGG